VTKIADPHQPGDGPDDTVLDETRLSPAAATPAPPTPTPTTTGWLTSSGAIDHGRFPPGTVLGGRYRVIGRLGRGGMGDVYRADDLKLGQPVALKFLPPDVDRDPARLTQLHTEVRMARQVSHPNVCRVYDIDEIDGHTFLSMEYVDGEDLASLLRRIGRFPQERGLELARQICAGLSSAHERGVVHRDLKPANVMLDSAGRVRITDFGLAGLAGEALRAGTPAYMAPEQLAGGEVTARSDIYALGLALYELFTGKRAIEGTTLAELINRRAHGEIVPPSAITRDLSPDVDRAIMRCLAPDPAQRPASALSVSAALPGGDPLAAALAAGETPSPEMVAAAGREDTLAKAPGLGLLAFVVVGLVAVALLCDRVLLIGRVPMTKSADVLEERAREIIAQTGYTERLPHNARGVSLNTEYPGWAAQNGSKGGVTDYWTPALSGNGASLRFWYRESPLPLEPRAPEWAPSIADPPLTVAGMTTVVVDERGRLLELVRVPPQTEAAPSHVTPDWNPLFSAAQLTMGDFTSVPPAWTPRVYADQRVAWEGPMRGHPDAKLRIEAASYGGRPVSFLIVWPWSRPARLEQPSLPTSARVLGLLGSLLALALMAGAIAIARHNLKSGRADRRGAARVALFLIGIWIMSWIFGARHWFSLNAEFESFFGSFAFVLLNVGFTWLFYLGLEPFVRKFCPDMLIGWTRLLAGQVRDARVGRDVLIGIALGVFIALITAADSAVLPLLGRGVEQPQTSNVQFLLGARYAVSGILRTLPNSLQAAMMGTFAYVMLLAIVRSRRVAAAGIMLLLTLVILVEDGGSLRSFGVVILALVLAAPFIYVFLRFGLLATAVALMTNQMLQIVPLTADPTKPHAAVSAMAFALLVVGAGYAFHTSKAGEGLFKRLMPA
jgi:serine/threonine-protein kinase